MNLTTDSHTLKTLLRGAKKIWLLALGMFIALVLIFCGGIHYYTNNRTGTSVSYTSTSKIMVAPDKNDTEIDGGRTQLYLNSEKSILNSKNTSSNFLKELKSKYNWKNSKMIEVDVSIKEGTSIFEIEATAPTAKKAVQTSNYIAKQVSSDDSYLLQNGSATVVEKAKKAKLNGTVSSNKKYYAVAVILSFLIAALITLIKAYFDKRIYDVELLSDNLEDVKIYESSINELSFTLKKVAKRTIYNDDEKEIKNLSLMYFEKDMKDVLASSINDFDLNKGYSVYTDDSDKNENQKSISDLYDAKKTQDESISIVDCSEEINLSSSSAQVMIIRDGITTKQQISKAYNELKMSEDTQIFAIYL